MMLHPVHRDHVKTYCGPWALGALTDTPQHVIRTVVFQAMAERASGNRRQVPGQITGLYVSEMTRALELLGHRAERVAEWHSYGLDPARGNWYVKTPRPTLKTWCRQLTHLNAPGRFLVHCGWHYVSAAFGFSGELWLSDNLQRTLSAVRWSDFRGADRRMWTVWSVTPLSNRGA